VHFSCDTWQGVHYYLTSEDDISHRLLATIITYRFGLLVRIKSVKWRENYYWKLYSCFYGFVLCDIYTGMIKEYAALLQVCLELLKWFMNNGQFPFLLYASRIFPDKMMESIVKRKLSLGTFWLSYGRSFCHMWTIVCREYDTQCVCEGQQNVILKNLYGMITEWRPTFSPKLSNILIHVLLCNIHHHLAVVFTSLEEFVRRQTVKWRESSLRRHSNNLTSVSHI
jgi:hypothetical protein